MTDTTSGQPAENATSLSDLLSGASHEAHQEAGSQPETASAPPAPPPAPVAETPPLAATAPPAPTPAPAVDPAAAPEASQPFWYRQQIKKEKQERERLQRELEELRAQRPQPAPEAAPDPYDDPQGYDERVQAHLAKMERRTNAEISARFAKITHGQAMYDETHDWLETRQDIVNWAASQPDPWEAAITAYKREKLAAEIGDDPAKWRETERQKMLADPEIRAQILAEMGASPAPAPQPTPQRPAPPPSASDTRSASPRGGGPATAGPTPLNSLFNTFK